MIPLPPADPALAGIGPALDGSLMGEVLARVGRHPADPPVNVPECTPIYVKYKPGKYCLVQYELELLDDEVGRGNRRLAHAVVYPVKRAEKLAARRGLVFDPLSSRQPNPSYCATYVPELAAIAQLYPVDPALPGLAEAASAERMGYRLAQDIPKSLGCDLEGCEVDLVRYKAEKRAVLKYRLRGAPVDVVYGKLRKDGGGALVRVTGALRRAGVPTPESLGWLRDLGMVVQSEGEGSRLSALRNSAAYERAMTPVAEALARLHGCVVPGLALQSPATEARELMDAARVIGHLLPHMRVDAIELARRLVELLWETSAAASTIHGSFHDDQVLVGDADVTFIDMDSAKAGNPQSDVGHFLSYLSANGADGAYSRFLAAYSAVHPGVTGDFLVFESASLLRWATLPFRELQPDWPEAIEKRIRCASDRLKARV